MLININYIDESGERQDSNQKLKTQAYAFLCIINQLPEQYRSDVNRISLLQSICNELSPNGYQKGLSSILKEFNSGALDEAIFGASLTLRNDTIINDFAPLAAALSIFKDVNSLEMKLRTGITTLPKSIDVLPPDAAAGDLLAELEQDDSTRNLSSLTKKIIAALHIPMHLNGSDPLSLGGISDISNKGAYDKLLLSELAQDDLLLSARLASNEALFLQRESTPKQETQELGIMIDSTLKMWGSARIFSVAAGLAFRAHKQQHQQLKVWSLGGAHGAAQGLETKQDVIALLEKMDPALHCAETLAKTFQTYAEKNGQYVFIISVHFLKDPACAPFLQKIKAQLSYLIAISAGGHLQMIQFNNGRSRLIREATIDLREVLSEKKIKKTGITQENLPKIMYEEKFPLYFPTSKVNHRNSYLYYTNDKSVITVSVDLRVLFWSNGKYGAVELIPHVERGVYCFGEIGDIIYLIIIPDKKEAIKIYSINSITKHYHLKEVKLTYKLPSDLKFIASYFSFNSLNRFHVIDPTSGVALPESKISPEEFHAATGRTLDAQYKIKRHINNGYSPINSCRSVLVFASEGIFVDKKQFVLGNNKFYWRDAPFYGSGGLKPAHEILKVDHLPNLRFTKYTFNCGSTIIMDSRGLLHLKSWNSAIAEVCIVMIVDQPTACWSADGWVSGSSYFIPEGNTGYVKPARFYEEYIVPFIDSLK